MDKSFNQIMKTLSENETHPMLADFWKNYLITKKERLIEAIKRCTTLFQNPDVLSQMEDTDLETIITLFFLQSTSQTI